MVPVLIETLMYFDKPGSYHRYDATECVCLWPEGKGAPQVKRGMWTAYIQTFEGRWKIETLGWYDSNGNMYIARCAGERVSIT